MLPRAGLAESRPESSLSESPSRPAGEQAGHSMDRPRERVSGEGSLQLPFEIPEGECLSVEHAQDVTAGEQQWSLPEAGEGSAWHLWSLREIQGPCGVFVLRALIPHRGAPRSRTRPSQGPHLLVPSCRTLQFHYMSFGGT